MKAPAEGTKRRAVYDLLVENRGKPVEIDTAKHNGDVLRSLRDEYMMEIDVISRYRNKSVYRLTGRVMDNGDYEIYTQDDGHYEEHKPGR